MKLIMILGQNLLGFFFSNLTGDTSNAAVLYYRTLALQAFYVGTNYSKDEIANLLGRFDSTTKFLNELKNYTGTVADYPNYVETIENALLASYLPLANKQQALLVASFARKSSSYWSNVAGNPQDPWTEYIGEIDRPKLLDIVNSDTYIMAALFFGDYLGYELIDKWGNKSSPMTLAAISVVMSIIINIE